MDRLFGGGSKLRKEERREEILEEILKKMENYQCDGCKSTFSASFLVRKFRVSADCSLAEG